LDSGAGKRTVAADRSLAQSLGVQGTPTYFVNGRRLTGAASIEEWRGLIDEEMAAADRLLRAGTPAGQLYIKLLADARQPTPPPPPPPAGPAAATGALRRARVSGASGGRLRARACRRAHHHRRVLRLRMSGVRAHGKRDHRSLGEASRRSAPGLEESAAALPA